MALLRKLREDASPEAWFLSGSTEKPVEPRCYRKSIQLYLRQASVRKIHPHALRHPYVKPTTKMLFKTKSYD